MKLVEIFKGLSSLDSLYFGLRGGGGKRRKKKKRKKMMCDFISKYKIVLDKTRTADYEENYR